MATRPPHATTDDDSDAKPGRWADPVPAYPGAPRWVKVSGLAILILVLLVAVVLVVGGGNHGPGRHTMPGGAGGRTAPVARGV